MTRVLAVASEIFPLIKTGGLADVTGALPLALMAGPLDVDGPGEWGTSEPSQSDTAGIRTTTMVPGYPAVMSAMGDAAAMHRFPDLFGGPATVLQVTAASLDLLVLDAPHLFDRPGNPYLAPDGGEWPDNGVRFAGLGAAAAAMATGRVPGLAFDILHAHDWQAAMAPVYLHFHQGRRPGSVLTVHNMAFQGRYPASLFPRLGLPGSAFGIDGLEYQGDVSLLKGGLVFADRLTTVSPTYAREITGIDNGMGLDGLMRSRVGDLTGILNGIDDSVWNPATDAAIPARFTRGRMQGKAINKAALQRRLGLTEAPDALLIGVISRMTSQKGLDLLVGLIAPLVAAGAQIAVLGSGDPQMEQAFLTATRRHSGAVGCILGYDEPLAHLIQAGSDALLVPSRFEPCGLTQLCALRYGAIPTVCRVGGLADSVIDANQAALAAGVATGLQFWPATGDALWDGLLRLLRLWRNRPLWQRTQRNGMAADVSWRTPAAQYAALYSSLITERA